MSQEITIPVIAFGTIAGVATLSGVILLTRRPEWSKRNSHFINSFAAGVILALAFFHLAPEAIELNELAFIYILIGFIAFFLIESVLILHSGAEVHYKHEHEHIADSFADKRAKGLVATIGLGFHSLIDGVIIGVGFEVSTEIGILTSIGVILHEFPEGITSISILLDAGVDKVVALRYAVIVAIATPIGAIGSLLFITGVVEEVVIGALLALAAGTFVYVSAADLIPELHERDNKLHVIILLAGIAFLYIITVAFG